MRKTLNLWHKFDVFLAMLAIFSIISKIKLIFRGMFYRDFTV